MEQLGLGVRLSLDDDMTREINPIIRDLERLRQQASRTTTTFNQMRNAHNPFGRNRRQEIRDYYDSMGSLDRVLLNVSDRFIRATKSANDLGKAVNRMQFQGNFNLMYRDMMRVQRMLGNMGYGMSKMQKDMSNLRAYQMMDVTIKDLHDKVKLTTQALKEMQKSPDASKMQKEMAVAKRALQAYQNELKRTGNLQNKLAQTHGLGQMKSATGAKDILYTQPTTARQMAKNQIAGLAMSDMAIASAIATKSLNKTEKALVGTGYTAMETKKKLTQMSTAMQTLGMTLTPIVSLVSALAIGGWGYLAGRGERANAQFSGQTLMSTEQAKPYQSSMRDSFANSPGTDRDSVARMYATMSNSGVKDTGTMSMLSKGANNIGYAWGDSVDSVQVVQSAMKIAQKTGVSYAESLDLISLGLKGTDGDLEKATESVLANAGAFKDANGEWKNAYETLEKANKDGSIQRLINGVKGLSNTLVILWDSGMKQIVGGLGDLITKVSNATNKFLEANPVVAKFAGHMLGIALAVGLLVPPILLVSGFLLKFRNVIQGVGLAVQALSARGGVMVLGAQATMLAKNVHAATVALARFPQTLMFGFLPVLYNVIRAVPNFILNMMRINPVMTALTVGMIAYQKNWFGFGDSVKGVITKIKSSVEGAKGILGKAIGGEQIDFSQYNKLEEVLSKTMGTAKIAKDVIKSVFTGETLKFNTEQTNLIEGLGIGGAVEKIALIAKGVKDFTDGFVDGVQLVYDKAKTFIGWMVDTFEPVIVRVGNFISKLFGGKGDATSVEDIMKSVSGGADSMKNLGKMAGVAVTALLGFKLIKPFLSGMFKGLVKNPFKGIISSAKTATKAVGKMTGAIRGTTSATGGRISSTATNVVRGVTGANARAVNSTITGNGRRAYASATGTVALPGGAYGSILRNRDGSASGTVLRRNSTPPISDAQMRRAQILTTNQNARTRGYDVGNHSAIRGNQPGVLSRSRAVTGSGTYAGNNQALRGQQVHARQQGRVSRALFGQAYDVYSSDGRRTNINRQGGLLRTSAMDSRVRERNAPSMRNRVSNIGSATRGGIARAGRATGGGIARAGRAVANTPGAQQLSSLGRTAMKPVTVPVRYVNSKIVKPVMKPLRNTVRWVSGRLQTAGVIRQGTTAGAQSGSKFKRAFNLATRGLGAGGRMFAGATRGAGRAGATAGRGMLGGMKFMSKGIGVLFKVGLKAIPFLGWALMAWDIISAVFTNWDKIKAGAMKAWNWIKTSGVDALKSAWDSIKEFANTAWTWIKEEGLNTAKNLLVGYVTFMGKAWVWIFEKAVQVFKWIFTDGLALVGKLALGMFKLLGKVFTDLVPWALGKFGSLVSSGAEFGAKIGSNMFKAIKDGFGDIGAWMKGKLDSGWSTVKGWFGGGKSDKATKHARGGIINAPHLGLVGEAGPEAIIPLSGNQRNRAQMLLQHTAGVLGMSVQKVGEQDTAMPVDDVLPTSASKSPKLSQNVVRSANTSRASQSDTTSGDNSVTIQKLEININDGKDVSEVGARKHAVSLAKELQKLMKQERLRGRGKNLSLEELILNL